jgi:hypothetical protein
MKKFIITSFFILMIGLSAGVLYAFRLATMPKEEISFEVFEDKISDTEVEDYNKRKVFQQTLVPKDGYRYVRYDEVKITRTKTDLGWETKIDTLKTYAGEEKCGC